MSKDDDDNFKGKSLSPKPPRLLLLITTLFPSYADAVKSELKNSICEACVHGKATRSLPKILTTVGSTVKAPLELVHSDVCGPFSQTSLTDHRYFGVVEIYSYIL